MTTGFAENIYGKAAEKETVDTIHSSLVFAIGPEPDTSYSLGNLLLYGNVMAGKIIGVEATSEKKLKIWRKCEHRMILAESAKNRKSS